MLNHKIIEVKTKRELKKFIEFPLSLYSGDPFYVPQLTRDLKVHFSPKNPFIKQAEVKFFLALHDGKVVGRIASIIDPHHISRHNEKTGFFGFLECTNEKQVAASLLDRVRDELKAKGMKTMRGPMNFSLNDECGFLIDGFDSRPMLMMPYNPSYYNDLMAEYGLTKSKDLNAYIYNVQEQLPDKVLRVASIVEKKGVTIRHISKKDFMRDMQFFRDVYNSAWAKNWGFVPITEEELVYSAARLKPIVVPELTLIAEKDGEAIGFLGMIPDFNSVLKQMNGKLNPVTIVKALYHSRNIKDLRLLLYGIKAEYRNKGVDSLLFKEGFRELKEGNYKRVEFSWILEDNLPVIRIIETIGGKLYKKYRIYEKRIDQQHGSAIER